MVAAGLLLTGAVTAGGQPPQFAQPKPPGALTGKTIFLSPGHGWYYHFNFDEFLTQRGNPFGVVEDFGTVEAVARYLVPYLENAGPTCGCAAIVAPPRSR